MAVPKKKTSKSKTRSRKATGWRLKKSSQSVCPECGIIKRPHRVCGSCGHYKGRTAIDTQ